MTCSKCGFWVSNGDSMGHCELAPNIIAYEGRHQCSIDLPNEETHCFAKEDPTIETKNMVV